MSGTSTTSAWSIDDSGITTTGTVGGTEFFGDMSSGTVIYNGSTITLAQLFSRVLTLQAGGGSSGTGSSGGGSAGTFDNATFNSSTFG